MYCAPRKPQGLRSHLEVHPKAFGYGFSPGCASRRGGEPFYQQVACETHPRPTLHAYVHVGSVFSMSLVSDSATAPARIALICTFAISSAAAISLCALRAASNTCWCSSMSI